jgi:hypothetical protein
MLGDDDLPTFFSDFGIPVTFGGVTVNALSDAYDLQEGQSMGADLSGRITDLTLASNSFNPFPKRNNAIVVNGVAMVVRDVEQQKDGGITHVYVVPA